MIASLSCAGPLDGPWWSAWTVERSAVDRGSLRSDLDARLGAVATAWSAAHGGTTTHGVRSSDSALAAEWEAGRRVTGGFGLAIRISVVLPADLRATTDSNGDLGESGHEDWRISTAAAGLLAGAGYERRFGRLWLRAAGFAGPTRGSWSARIDRRFDDPVNDVHDSGSRTIPAAGNAWMTELEVNAGWRLGRSLTAFATAGWRRCRIGSLAHSRAADRDGDGVEEAYRGFPVLAPDGTPLALDFSGGRLAVGIRVALGAE